MTPLTEVDVEQAARVWLARLDRRVDRRPDLHKVRWPPSASTDTPHPGLIGGKVEDRRTPKGEKD